MRTSSRPFGSPLLVRCTLDIVRCFLFLMQAFLLLGIYFVLPGHLGLLSRISFIHSRSTRDGCSFCTSALFIRTLNQGTPWNKIHKTFTTYLIVLRGFTGPLCFLAVLRLSSTYALPLLCFLPLRSLNPFFQSVRLLVSILHKFHRYYFYAQYSIRCGC